MVRLYGQEWTAAELRRHVGIMDQIAGITPGERTDGTARGVRTLDVQTGGGLSFTVLPERGMDIGETRLNGVPLAWYSAMGVVHPSRHERDGRGWERSFAGGLLATCGMDNIGAPNTDEGTAHPLHGRVNNIPATHVRYDGRWEGDEYLLSVEGRVRQVNLYGENLLLTRRIESALGSTALTVTDHIVNDGYRPEPVILLHHINLGFPVLAPTSELLIPPGTRTTPEGDDRWQRADAPGSGAKVFNHHPTPDADGMVEVALVNRAFAGGRGIGVSIRYTHETFPLLWQWRNLFEGEYVMGLEPASNRGAGRHALREAGELRILEPGESVTFGTTITALGDADAIDAAARRIGGA